MRFGLALPHYGFSLPGGEEITFERMAWFAQRAEALGFDSIWLSDHFFYTFGRYGAGPSPIPSLEPMTALAGLSAITERIRIGSLVLCAPFRHPAVLAKMAATIDRISGGRLDLGLGAGWLEEEFVAFGYAFGTAGERFASLEDTFRALSAWLSAEPVTVEGHEVPPQEARPLPPPIQRPRVPLWLGAKGGDRALALAARHADGWNTVWRWSPAAYAERAAAAGRACETVGRDPATLRRSVGLHALIAQDDRALRAVFERGRAAMPGGALDGEALEGWCADTLSGTPEQVIERVHAFADLGVTELIVSPWVLPFAIPEPEILDLFAEGVIAPLRASA